MAVYRDRHLHWAKDFLSRNDPGYRFRWEVYFGELERLLKDVDSFLDAGCGDNQTVRELFFSGFKIGVDQRRPEDSDHFCCARLEQLPFPPGSFEVIGCRFVLEHLPDPHTALQEFSRVLRPGGFLLTQTTNRTHPLIFLSRLLPRRFKQRLARLIYGRTGGTEQRTYHRFNHPHDFGRPQAGLIPMKSWFVEDLHLEFKPLFYVSYRYHALTRRLRCTSRRSTITVLWEKPVETSPSKGL